MATLNIATFNCAGMANSLRRAALFDQFRKLPAHIILVQETHSNVKQEAKWTQEWAPRTVIFNSNKNSATPTNGVAIFINDVNTDAKTITNDLDGRIIAVDITIQGTTLHLINIYAPVGNMTTKDAFFNKLYPYTLSNIPTIMAGDFNIVDQPTVDRFPPGNNAERSKALISLCSSLRLTDAYRDLYGETSNFTRRQGNTQSRLDRLYISKEIDPANQTTIPNILSDHDVVILQIRNIKPTQREKGLWINNFKIYDLQQFKDELTDRWTKWQTLHPILFVSKTDWWMHIKTRIKEMNQKHARRQARQRKIEEQNLEKDFKETWENLLQNPKLLQKFHSIKKQLLQFQLQNTKEKVFKERAIAKGNFALGSKEFFEHFAENRSNTNIEMLTDAQGKLQTETEDILKTIHDFYQHLFREKPNDPEAADHLFASTPTTK